MSGLVMAPGMQFGPGGQLGTGQGTARATGRRRTRVRWDRVAVLVAALAVLVSVLIALRAGSQSATAGTTPGDGAMVAPVPTALVTRTVVPGDTLWAIASSVDPGADPRPMVDRIMRLNGLTSGDVAVGRHLVVPSRP